MNNFVWKVVFILQKGGNTYHKAASVTQSACEVLLKADVIDFSSDDFQFCLPKI